MWCRWTAGGDVFEIEGSVALVTGAAFGLGRSVARRLAAAGARVVIADVADCEGEATAAGIVMAGGEAHYIHCDVSSQQQVEDCVAQTISAMGGCDLLVSNAAIAGHGAPHDFSAEQWRRMIEVDLLGSVWATRALLPHMLQRDRGHLSLVSSGAGFTGTPDCAPYATAKFGMVGLAESLALYVRGTGVSVSLVAPGAIGGEHADTFVVAADEQLDPEHVAAVKRDRDAKTAAWPEPDAMAETIVEGIAAGRFFIIQETPEHEDWLRRLWASRAADPEAFLR